MFTEYACVYAQASSSRYILMSGRCRTLSEAVLQSSTLDNKRSKKRNRENLEKLHCTGITKDDNENGIPNGTVTSMCM